MARVVRGCSLVLSWGEEEGVVDKGGWGGWVLVASSDVMSAMLGEEAGGVRSSAHPSDSSVATSAWATSASVTQVKQQVCCALCFALCFAILK